MGASFRLKVMSKWAVNIGGVSTLQRSEKIESKASCRISICLKSVSDLVVHRVGAQWA